MTASDITAEIKRVEARMAEVEHEGFEWRTLDNTAIELERSLYRAHKIESQTITYTDWL